MNVILQPSYLLYCSPIIKNKVCVLANKQIPKQQVPIFLHFVFNLVFNLIEELSCTVVKYSSVLNLGNILYINQYILFFIFVSANVTPFPNPEITPPVTKMYFVIILYYKYYIRILNHNLSNDNCEYLV